MRSLILSLMVVLSATLVGCAKEEAPADDAAAAVEDAAEATGEAADAAADAATEGSESN